MRWSRVGSNWENIGGSASPDYKTAQRQDDGSWASYSGEESAIMGTPKATNTVSDEQSEDDSSTQDEEDQGEDDESDGEAESEEEDDTEESRDTSEEDIPEAEVSLSIDEVIFDTEGSDEGNERITISNNGTSTVVLEEFSIQYLKSDGDFSNIAKKNFESGHSIEDDFIVGMNCSSSSPCESVDMSWSQSLGNDSGTIYLVLNQEKITDSSDVDIHTLFEYKASIGEDP